MFEVKLQKGKACFSIRPDNGAHTVCVAGDFSAWKPIGLTRSANGRFEASVPLKPGVYQYKFIIDGEWTTDPANASCASNPFGTANSVAKFA